MVLEKIDTEMGEDTVFVEGGDVMATKITSTPTNFRTTPKAAEDSENMEPAETHEDEEENVRDEAEMPEDEAEAPHDETEQPAATEEATPAIEVEAVPEAVPDAVEEIIDERDFDKNPTVLFALLQKKEWTAAIERSHLYQEECDVWVSRKEKDGRLRWRLLPVHAAIVFKAPADVIETLLGAYPMGAQAKDDQGMLPLHLAFRNGASEEIVDLLLVSYPHSIDVKDRKGRTPLVLAQASTSPNKDAFLRALERGPSYYVGSAAKADRAAVAAEQRAIFEAKLMQVKQSHQHELAAVQLESENKHRDLHVKIEEMENELEKTQETSQVLVDHVNSLEAQLNTRSDTERFLATKIATLDSSLQNTEKTREEVEQQLKLQNFTLIAERDGYKSKLEGIEKEYEQVQTQLTESVELFEKREQEWAKTKKDLEGQVKSHQMDWAQAKANCAILDAQLKKKMETEHALATQVSSLAGKLAENAADARDYSNKYTKKIKEMEEERMVLRDSVQDLTKRLKLVATLLEDMGTQQNKIIQESKFNDFAIAQALEAHAAIVAEAQAQADLLVEVRQEREEMQKKLIEQEEKMAANEEKRSTIMDAIAVHGDHMAKTKGARDDMVESVKAMGEDVKGVLENILSVLPTDGEEDGALVDAVVKSITSPATEEELSEEKKEEEAALPTSEA
jgi:hypothetical protein